MLMCSLEVALMFPQNSENSGYFVVVPFKYGSVTILLSKILGSFFLWLKPKKCFWGKTANINYLSVYACGPCDLCSVCEAE